MKSLMKKGSENISDISKKRVNSKRHLSDLSKLAYFISSLVGIKLHTEQIPF